jgi:hypothetical protein
MHTSKQIGTTKNNTPHKRKQRTKRKLTTTVTPITKLSLKRNDYRKFYTIKENNQLKDILVK